MPLHLVPLWVGLRCGGCGQAFTGNARSVPQWKESPACPKCWGRINDLRVQLGFPPWDTPVDAYLDEGSPSTTFQNYTSDSSLTSIPPS